MLRALERAAVRAALQQHDGNITRAAVTLDISKTWCMALVRRYGLNAWARDLRVRAGSAATGRPTSAPRA